MRHMEGRVGEHAHSRDEIGDVRQSQRMTSEIAHYLVAHTVHIAHPSLLTSLHLIPTSPASNMEKSMPPPTTAPAERPRRSRTRLVLASLASLLAVMLIAPALPLPTNLASELRPIPNLDLSLGHLGLGLGDKGKTTVHCPAQPKPIHPPSTIEWSDDSRARSTELFRAAVRIPTQSYDDNGEPGEDGRWAPFFKFQDWLKESFPAAWGRANVEFVNSE